MRAHWQRWFDSIRTGFWFVPIVMLFFSFLLALGFLRLDQTLDPGIEASLPWAYTGGPSGARSLLSTIAGSMITAASVTFSLASVALSIASQQYGSRVLRNFMRDKVTQFLLGTFVSTFLYSVMVVRDIRGSEYGGGFVPSISVTIAIVLSVASLVLLVYFIHHVSTSIQASRIISVIAEEITADIPRLFPSGVGQASRDLEGLGRLQNGRTATINIAESGYLQMIDADSLMKVAVRRDLVIEIVCLPGAHLIQGMTVAHVYGNAVLEGEDLDLTVKAFALGGQRTPAQDIRYPFQQLTDVVVRALSPAINDPFTAINGIDELTAGISALARRERVAESRQDDQGKLRLVIPQVTIGAILRETVGHIAIYGAADHFVMDGLRQTLDIVEPDLKLKENLQAIASLREELNRRQSAKTATLSDRQQPDGRVSQLS
jgi:uncharacterized membrane protein